MLFSILIPTYNRPAALDRCLAALSALDFPSSEFEVLVIDDGSAPPIDHVVQKHLKTIPVRLLTQQNRGPAVARNYGLSEACGKFIVFTDDDCRPTSGWLNSLRHSFETDPSCAWGGKILSAPENSIFGVASQMLVTYLYRNNTTNTFFCTNNLSFPREALIAIGGFDETLPLAAAEDREICDRWGEQYKFRFDAEATILHQQMLSFAGFCRQHFRYGRGAYHFQARLLSRGKEGIRIRRFPFYMQMILEPWNSHKFPQAVMLSCLLALSQCLNIFGYLYERISYREGQIHPFSDAK